LAKIRTCSRTYALFSLSFMAATGTRAISPSDRGAIGEQRQGHTVAVIVEPPSSAGQDVTYRPHLT
jgi:hypothetical protein